MNSKNKYIPSDLTGGSKLLKSVAFTIGFWLLQNTPQTQASELIIKPLNEKHHQTQQTEFPQITDFLTQQQDKIHQIIVPFSPEYSENHNKEYDPHYFEDPNLAPLFYGLQKEGTMKIISNIEKVLNFTSTIEEKIQKHAEKTGISVPLKLVQGLILTESGGDPKAISWCGAKGLGQFMPGTAKQYHVKVFDPVSSIDGIIHKLTDDYIKFNNRTYAISAYHMGPGNVNTILGAASNEGMHLVDASQFVDPNLPQTVISFLSTKKDDTELYFRKIQSAISLINGYSENPLMLKEQECFYQESVNHLIGGIKNPDNLRSSHIVAQYFQSKLQQDSVTFDHSCMINYLSNYTGDQLTLLDEPIGDNRRETQSIIGKLHQEFPQQGLLVKKPAGIAGSRLDHILKYHMTQGNIWISDSGLYYYVVQLKEFAGSMQ